MTTICLPDLLCNQNLLWRQWKLFFIRAPHFRFGASGVLLTEELRNSEIPYIFTNSGLVRQHGAHVSRGGVSVFNASFAKSTLACLIFASAAPSCCCFCGIIFIVCFYYWLKPRVSRQVHKFNILCPTKLNMFIQVVWCVQLLLRAYLSSEFRPIPTWNVLQL